MHAQVALGREESRELTVFDVGDHFNRDEGIYTLRID